MPSGLIAALEYRDAEIRKRYEAVEERIAHLENERDSLDSELSEVAALLERYSDQTEVLRMEASGKDVKPGPTEAIRKLLRSQPGRRMDYGPFLNRMQTEIESGRVLTSATDARKLVSGMVAQLIRTRQLMKTRDVIYLVGGSEQEVMQTRRPGPHREQTSRSEPKLEGGDDDATINP